MRFLLFPVLILPLILVRFSAAAAAPPSIPEPEQFGDDSHYLQYAKAADSFLHDNPDSPAAPRVAMELMLTGSVLQDQASALKMRKLIICNYPDSTQARYLIATTPDAATFAALMGEIAAEGFDAITPAFASHFDQAMRMGVARFGARALGDGATLVRTFILSSVAGDQQLLKSTADILNASGPRGELWRRILLAITDRSTAPLARLSQLHALGDRAAVIPFEQFLLNQLSPADRATSQVIQIEADDLLDADRLADALPLLAKVPGPAQARIQFWQAWASAATGDSAAAKTIFAQLHHDHPTDPWDTEAADLAPAITGMDAALGRNVEAALSAARRIKAGTDVVEGHAVFTRSDAKKIDIYVGLDIGKLFELTIHPTGETGLIYRATDQEGLFYFQGGGAIARFTKPALPAPRFGLVRVGNDFLPRGDMQFIYSFDDLRTALGNLVASPDLSTREGLQDVLHSFVRRGAFPLPPQPGAGGATICTWVCPAVATPTTTRVSFTVAPDGQITAFQSGDFSVTQLRYGPAGSFAITVPPFPDLKAIDRGTMDVQILQQLLPAFYSFFLPPPPATQPAAVTNPVTAPPVKPAAK